jgi:hypothetical protein
LAVASLLLVAWFVVLARDNHLASGAAQRIHAHPEMTSAEWAGAIDDLRAGELLNPGTEWRINRANYLLLRDKRKALAVANAILRREPDSLDAWAVVLKATPDARRRAEAMREIRRLNPAPPGAR